MTVWIVLALGIGGREPPIPSSSLSVVPTRFLASRSGEHHRQDSVVRRGMTLFPDGASPGELLRFVTDGASRAEPESAKVIRDYVRGDTVRAHRSFQLNGVRWIELRNTGYVEAARVDRVPVPVRGNLAAGREGLSLGRVLPWDYEPSDLEPVAEPYKAADFETRALRLRREARRAFERMIEAAAAEGVVIRLFSGWRSAEYQAALYARNVDRRGPTQRVSAAPGRSEHQLGTAADVAAPGVPLMTPALADAAAGRWIARRSAEFGIAMTFSRERHERRGVAFEPWHLRWVGDAVNDDREW